LRVAGIRGSSARGGLGDVAGLCRGFEGLALVLKVAFGRLHEVWDEVVAALELDINLGEGVFEAVPQSHKLVVLPGDEKQDEPCHDGE
jgi:hypothetical protein